MENINENIMENTDHVLEVRSAPIKQNELLYHRVNGKRFSALQNAKIVFCKIFGHQLNNNCRHENCERCGLAYEEIYYKQNYYNL